MGSCKKVYTMAGPYYEECEGGSEGPEIFNSKSALSATEKDRAARESDIAGECVEVERRQNQCKQLCPGELILTPCEWK